MEINSIGRINWCFGQPVERKGDEICTLVLRPDLSYVYMYVLYMGESHPRYMYMYTVYMYMYQFSALYLILKVL